MTITETLKSAPADKKAASLVPQIVKAHEQLVEIESEGFAAALAKAIELGMLLNLAQEAVYKGHFWAWFKEQQDRPQGFRFSDRSARRYMRLAENREALESALADRPRVASLAGEGQLSIRAAEALLAPASDDADSDDSDSDEDDDSDSDSDSADGKSDAEKLRDLIREMALSDFVTVVVEAIGPPAQQIADGISQRLTQLAA